MIKFKLFFAIVISIITPILSADPAEILIGERLFLEQRFSHFYYLNSKDQKNLNSPLQHGDPTLNKTVRFFGLPPYQIPFEDSPFKDGTYSCRSCHMVDEHLNQKELGMRGYADFASRSPISIRDGNNSLTVRNSPVLVSSTPSRENFILHFDGEFSTTKDLIIGTLTDGNLGWNKKEYKIAKEHICNVIKNDDGNEYFSNGISNFSYSELFSGSTSSGDQLPTEYLTDEDLHINVQTSSCDVILQQIAIYIEMYIDDLSFANDEEIISPYDQFLKINHLPSQPLANESDQAYSQRLLELIHKLESQDKIKFVTKNPNTEDGNFKYHDQIYKFTEQELIGLKIFFNQSSTASTANGNCVACHPAPHFSDFGLHNTGITQIEYEAIHGQKSFLTLPIPTLLERNNNADSYLPATQNNPERLGVFRQAATQESEMYTDLGAWNIIFNDDFPKPQSALRNLICINNNDCNTNDKILNLAIATFKTPTIRNLGHSAPYMHNGQISDLHAIIGFYVAASASSRQGLIRNPDDEMKAINISINDIQPLVNFLISLYEDYE